MGARSAGGNSEGPAGVEGPVRKRFFPFGLWRYPWSLMVTVNGWNENGWGTHLWDVKKGCLRAGSAGGLGMVMIQQCGGEGKVNGDYRHRPIGTGVKIVRVW